MSKTDKRVVMKFGGKCLANLELIKAVADYIHEYRIKNQPIKIVVVVSAMGSFTNDTLKQIQELAPNTQTQQGREVDYVTQAGEGIAAGLVTLRLNEIGVKAKSLNALQLNICTTGSFQNARITNIDTAKLENEFSQNDVLVITGFQGVHESETGVIVTLGRGGSDTTAVAIAACLNCNCQFYKKGNGVTVCDTDLVPEAKVLKRCSFSEALDLATYGYEFLHTRCLLIARRFGVRLEFKASPGLGGDPWAQGTFISERLDVIEEQTEFCALAVKQDLTLITINGVSNRPGAAAEIFTKVQNFNLVDFQQIIYGQKRAEALIAMVIADQQAIKIKNILDKMLIHNPLLQISAVKGLANLTLINSAMSQESGFGLIVSNILCNEQINIEGQYTSGDKIHTLIDPHDVQKAALSLAYHFQLSA